MTEMEFKKARNTIITIYVVAIILAISMFIVTKVRCKVETAEAEKIAESLETENLEAEQLRAERLEAEKLEQERLETEKLEQKRLEAEKLERERLEAAKLEQERLEAEKLEQERLEAEKLEQERLEAEKLEAERLEKERITEIIAKVIYAEARGEPFEGKIAVGATVINRMRNERFPDKVEDVIKGAYARIDWVTDEMLTKVPQCREAAERAVAGEDPLRDILGGSTLYFYNPDICSKTALKNRKGIETQRIGNHLFYTSTPDGRW